MMQAGKFQCIPLPTNPCNDFNTCTNDSCDPVKGCLYVNLAGGAACTDSNVCTAADLCTVNGSTVICSGSGIANCADTNVCTLDFCHQAVGCLFKDASCKDHNPCTIDACGGSGCTNTFSAAACPVLTMPFSDAVACTDTQWTLTPGIKGASSTTTAVWAVDATPMPPVPYTGRCTLNFNDGTGYVGSHWGRAVSNGTFSAVGKSVNGHRKALLFGEMRATAKSRRAKRVGPCPSLPLLKLLWRVRRAVVSVGNAA